MTSNRDDDEPSFDIYGTLKKRLETTKTQKEMTQKRIHQLNDELQRLFGKIPKKPKETLAVMHQKVNALEYKRTTTSWTLNEEKAILKEIHGIQKQKLLLEEYVDYEKKVLDKKTELQTLRESLKTTITAMDELEHALQKVRLAAKLGCTVADLTNVSIDCQAEKMGRVIGKHGATIKAIEKQCLVVMDVDSVAAKIHLTGPTMAIEAAIQEIDKIVQSVDEDVGMDKHVLGYLTTKRVTALADIRREHPNVTLEPNRDKKHVSLRGLPDHVEAAKKALEALDLVSHTRQLVGKEYATLVGKSGATINTFVDDHQVMIDVDEVRDEEWLATVTGPQTNVEACFIDIERVLAMNRDAVEMIPVDAIVRSALLSESGALIKKFQSEVNEQVKPIGGQVIVNFSKDQDDDNKATLVIKGRYASVAVAKDMVNAMITNVLSSLIVINVDTFVIPRIIGKGGETIKKLKDGKAVNIEVDKILGRVVIQSADHDEAKRVEGEVNAIILENQLVRIDFQSTVVKSMFREITRSDIKTKITELVWFGLDEDTNQIILRGPRNKLDEAVVMVNKFIKENYMEELEISAEDEPALFVGGSDSAISKLSSELGVDLSIVKARYVLVIKGLEEKVQMAVKRVKQFLYGGDGHTVSRIAITEQSLGVVIGKGGAKRAELEKKYEGISLFIHKSNRITIRGPEHAVEGCRIDILRLVSSMKIQEVLDITPEQYAILNAPELIRRATNGIPVQVTLTEVSVKIRGFFADVRDAKAMLKEPLFGFYEARVELDPSQLSCVRGACRNDGHFKRMEEIAGAKVSLDLATSAIVITGKRPNVKRAKVLVVEFIDFLLPSDFAHLKISKTLHSTVGDASVLADVAAVSGATVIFDRDTSSIEVQSSDPAKVKKAADILKSRIEEAEKLAFVVTLDQSDSWLIPLIIGKGGNRVNTFRLEFGCQVDISKEERSITVSGDSEEIVAKARKGLDEIIDAARRECAFVQIPADAVAPFLGRAGANIQIFAKEHTVEIERMRKESSKFKISGAEGNVQAAKAAVAAFVAGWEERSAGTTIQVDKNAIPAIIGKGGQNISFIQNEYKCKVEINREEFTVSVRGGSEELREKALQKINQIIAEDKASFAARQSERHARCAQENDEAEATGTPKPQSVKATTNGATADSEKKDRTSEFSARPVGLTIVENEKPKKKRIRNKNKTKDISDDSTLQVGTAAGRNLFNLLVTEKSIPNTDDNATSTVSNSARAATIDQWDSSTVSSAKDDCSGIDEERSGFVRGTNKPYIKSASGFTVRV